ncbi:hypothetical protein OHA70_01930 [Kribbella sp. NBC_00382]|uniref:hypothetical protein n=1 Tax=Kribbella sp. NBC_00382 TaxID=2975967 RepID=UPI002E1BFA57
MPPEPRDLLRAFARHGPVDWGTDLPTTAEIAARYGAAATERSLRLLEHAVATEPLVTAEFCAAIGPDGAAYQLQSRIKSPQSLARKLRDAQRSGRELPPDDLLRYTVLTEHPDPLVTTTRQTTDELDRAGWRMTYAMHSYTEGSRYKGIHTYFVARSRDLVEVQFHSLASAKIKEATTPYYEIERSADATLGQRAVARQECVRLSATLVAPRGIDNLQALGGQPVEVNNYSDSRQQTKSNSSGKAVDAGHPDASQRPTATRSDGIQR